MAREIPRFSAEAIATDSGVASSSMWWVKAGDADDRIAELERRAEKAERQRDDMAEYIGRLEHNLAKDTRVNELAAKLAAEQIEKAERELAEAREQVAHWRAKAKCYGDMVRGCSPALARAGFPVDGGQVDGAVGGVKRSVEALARRAEQAERERDEARRKALLEAARYLRDAVHMPGAAGYLFKKAKEDGGDV